MGPIVRHTLYEDPVTRKFAVIRLPSRYVEGDKLPIPPTASWFGTRDEALEMLSQLFDEDEDADLADCAQ